MADEQQALLELTDTGDRLRQEYELLDQTRRQLAARTVLMDTFRDLGDSEPDADSDGDPAGDSEPGGQG